jgi:hypothetical protein
MYLEARSDSVDYNDMKKAEYEIKHADGTRVKGSLDNNYDGTFTAEVDMVQFSAGSGTVKLKLEDLGKNKYQPVIPITVTD